jgi:SAM-dependent methyltransferase
MSSSSSSSNSSISDPLEYWNGPAAERWVRDQVDFDRMVGPFGDAAIEASKAGAGESVLDVGCGCGETVLGLASRVGPTGRVVGVDLSVPMLTRAKERCRERSNVSFLEGDASKVIPEQPAFDLAFSRFGVMFFTDPVVAFRRIHAALRPTGRLSFVCWRSLDANPWAAVPFDAAMRAVGRPEPTPPDAPGPFSFADPARVRGILEAAGFRDVSAASFESEVGFGPASTLDEAATAIVRLGPVARLLADRDEEARSRAIAAIREVLPPYVDARGEPRLKGAAWVVTARR